MIKDIGDPVEAGYEFAKSMLAKSKDFPEQCLAVGLFNDGMQRALREHLDKLGAGND